MSNNKVDPDIDLVLPPLRSERPERTVFADARIAGEIIRIVVENPLRLRADSVTAALEELRSEHEAFRRFVVDPPRGHAHLNAALLLPAFSGAATRSLVVASQFGYVPLAGTPLIASAVVAIELQKIPAPTGCVPVTFETALGPQVVEAVVEEGSCGSARWLTAAPAVKLFDHDLDIGLTSPIPVALIDTGLPYIVARASSLDVRFSDIERLGASGRELSSMAGRKLPMERFGLSGRTEDYPVLVVGEPELTVSNTANVPMAWIYPDGRVARMPAGTGALAVAAFCNAAGICEAETLINAISPFGEVIRSRLDNGKGQAIVEADVKIVSIGVLV